MLPCLVTHKNRIANSGGTIDGVEGGMKIVIHTFAHLIGVRIFIGNPPGIDRIHVDPAFRVVLG